MGVTGGRKEGLIRDKGSIQAKLLRSFALQSGAVLILAFSSVMFLDWRRESRHLAELESAIRAALDAKGRNLTGNLGLAIRPLLEDNAIASIREIVDSLAAQDSDIAYAAYVDAEGRPWSFRSRIPYGREAGLREILVDSVSLWAASVQSPRSRKWSSSEGEYIEFAAPMSLASESRGVVRVGLDTRSMREALEASRYQVWVNRKLTLGAFLAAALCAFLLSLALSRLQSRRFARPVLELAAKAHRLAGGDYSGEIKARGAGEIALLGEVFETMRLKIQAYTHRLESLVAEKVRQIGDLLENVDQGLFTFNLDLTVNPDHSARACTVLRLEKLAGRPLDEVLRMNPVQAGLFRDWVDVVRREHSRRRWSKLAKLAPLREMVLDAEEGARIIAIDYRKILDAEGSLSKIMVLAQDVTENRVLERRLHEEKTRHESRVRIILGVAGHAEEVMAGFLKDLFRRLDSMRGALDSAKPGWQQEVFFDCHTLKGNAGGFGFESLMLAAQGMETHLQVLGQRDPGPDMRRLMEESLRKLEEEGSRIVEVYRMLSGSLERPPVRVDPDKVDRLQAMAERAGQDADPRSVRDLVEACGSLRFRRLSYLALKYQELIHRAAQQLGKEVEFKVLTPDVELDPALILGVDEALVHIFRNCMAHGIEEPEVRARKGKGKGRIEFSYSRTGTANAFAIRDDGTGIDGEALAKRVVALGMMSPREAAILGEEAKAQLIFLPGLSTTSAADTLSGRGQGMAIALEKVHAIKGELTVETWADAGARFTISFPDPIPPGAPIGNQARAVPLAT